MHWWSIDIKLGYYHLRYIDLNYFHTVAMLVGQFENTRTQLAICIG